MENHLTLQYKALHCSTKHTLHKTKSKQLSTHIFHIIFMTTSSNLSLKLQQQFDIERILFRPGDTVILSKLKTKKKWNGKIACIKGPLSSSNFRWPVQVRIAKKPQALIKSINLRMKRKGIRWKIDSSSPFQRLNLLLKSYTKDLQVFAKITASKKVGIFDEHFKYELHDDIVCHSLHSFDQQLNTMKNAIAQMSADDGGCLYPILDELCDTQVLQMDNELKQFEVNVKIDLGYDIEQHCHQIWCRKSYVWLDLKSGLVTKCKLMSVEVKDKKENNEENVNSETKSILETIEIADQNRNENKIENKLNGNTNDNKEEETVGV